MRHLLREIATAAGSVAVLVTVILLVASDAETAVALGTLCIAGLVVHRAYDSSGVAGAVGSRLSARAKRVLGAVFVLAVIVAVSDGGSSVVVLSGSALFGYVGFRTGSVLQGALYGTVGGVIGALTLLALVGALLVTAAIVGVDGARAIALKTLIAPQIASFVTLVWTVFVVALGGVVGLVSGSVGGALARLY